MLCPSQGGAPPRPRRDSQERTVGFTAAIQSVFRQYATFSGRARRSEFWWFGLFTGVLYVLGLIIDASAGTQALVLVVGLALILPSVAVTARRLHDTNRSGWWILFGFIPIVGGIVLLVFECQDSNPGPNKFGDSPKYPAYT
jgi:uncharacterized membrane protein YhaH (DUF805 family)